eukprot:gi/632940908/ref/XP_007885584.1/ PREDICTED: tetraspanin-32 isoform X1 [Callorhinchus milii]
MRSLTLVKLPVEHSGVSPSLGSCQPPPSILWDESLGVSLVVVSLWISFSTEFSAIRNVNIEYNKYPAIHDLGVYSCISASAFLILVGLLCAVGTLKESEYLLGIVFFCFALQFCGVVQLIYWRYTSKELVENAVKDVYDFLYEDYMRNTSSPSKHHLTSLHSTFSCCGKTSVFSLYSIVENETCFTEGAAFVGEPQKDCLRALEELINSLMVILRSLTLWIGITTIYGMILTSFFCFAACLNESWYKKGKYTLPKA